MSYWSKLSMKDRANVMKLFLNKGISDLDTMRREYNIFAEGGNTSYSYTKPLDNVYVDSEGNVLDPSVPSAKGTIRTPDVVIVTRDPRKAVPTANSLNTSNIESTVKEATKNYFVGNLSDDEVRRRLYHNLAPYGYTHTIARLESAIKNNTSHEFDRRHKNDRDRQDIWAEYLGIPEEERKALFDSSTSILRDSQYSPTVGKEQNIKYKAISNPSEADVRDLIQHAEVLPIGKNKVVAGGIGHALGRYTIGHNYDNKGEYVSYYDKWDLNPFSNAGEDLSLGIGKPVNIYDRIYLDDYYGTPEEYRGSTYIPELIVTANKYADGGDTSINLINQLETNRWNPISIKTISERARQQNRGKTNNRLRGNASFTKQGSERIENEMDRYLAKSQREKGSSISEYDIPFIPEKAIVIDGSLTSTNVLDSLAKYAGIHNRSPKLSQKTILKRSSYPAPRAINKDEMLGLSTQETHNGALPYFNYRNNDEYNKMLGNSNYLTAFGYLPAENLVRNFHYNKDNVDRSTPPLLDAFQYFAQGDYNRGDAEHTTSVNNTGKRVWQNPKVKQWWEESGKYWYNNGKGKDEK